MRITFKPITSEATGFSPTDLKFKPQRVWLKINQIAMTRRIPITTIMSKSNNMGEKPDAVLPTIFRPKKEVKPEPKIVKANLLTI